MPPSTRRLPAVDEYLDVSDPEMSTLDRIEHLETLKAIEHALQSLTVKDRLILQMHYFDRRTIQEISQTLEMSPSALRARIYRAVKALRSKLLEREISGEYSKESEENG